MIFQLVIQGFIIGYHVLKVEVYAGAIYDAIYLYAIALNETLAAGGDKKDGRAIVHRMLNKEFEGTCPCVQQVGLYRGNVMLCVYDRFCCVVLFSLAIKLSIMRIAVVEVVETLFMCQSRLAGETPLLIWGHKVNR